MIELIKLELNLFIKARSISKIQAIYRAKVAVVILKYDYMTFLRMQFQVKLIIFTYLKTEDSLASKVHFCGLDLPTTSLCVGGPWVWIPSGAQIFNVPSYGWFSTSPFISFIIYYTPWHWLVGWLEAPSWVRHFLLLTWLHDAVKP